MDISRETLMAYIDGELAPFEEERVEEQIARDPELAAYVARQKSLTTQLRGAFAPVLEESVPARLEEAVLEGTVPGRGMVRTKKSGGGWSKLFQFPVRRPVAWIPVAAAAGLVFGVFLASGPQQADSGLPALMEASLEHALNNQLAADGTVNGLRIGMTFRNADGNVCRSFSGDAGGNYAGIACREGDGWRIAAVTGPAAEIPAQGEFRQADAAIPDALRTQIESMMVGAPFDAVEERAARDSGWQNIQPAQ